MGTNLVMSQPPEPSAHYDGYSIKIGDISVKMEDITLDDMPNQYFRDIAELCGMDVACKILSKFQGNLIQVPTRGFKQLQERIILDGYDNSAQSIKVLARKLICSEKYIRDVITRKRGDAPVKGQKPLFLIQNNTIVYINGSEDNSGALLEDKRNERVIEGDLSGVPSHADNESTQGN